MLALRISLIATLILAMSACAGGGGSNKGGTSTESPRILSVPSTTATVGAIYRYDCTAIGTPSPTLSFSGLPSWMMSDSRTIWGTPQAQHIGSAGPITVTADNGTGSVATQIFSITVSGIGGTGSAPQITSSPGTTATVGFLYEYNIVTTGSPAPTLGAMNLPAWLSLSGTTLSGTPAAGDVGQTPPMTITASNGTAPDATQSFAIDVDPAPTGPVLSFSGSTTLTEGDAGGMLGSVDVILTPGTQTPLPTVSVDYATSDGTALETDDYIATSGTLSFSPGQTTKTITFYLIADQVYEPDETFTITLSNPVNATIQQAARVLTIVNDDAPPQGEIITAASRSFREPTSGTSMETLYVGLMQANPGTITVDYTTSGGSASSPADYSAVGGTLTFMPGELTKFIDVVLVGDSVAESDETFTFTLSNPTNATIATPSSTVTIKDSTNLQTEIWMWGDNTQGSAGTGDKQLLSFPLHVIPQFNNTIQILEHRSATIALLEDGTLWSWGRNHLGQLGDPNAGMERLTPGRVQGLSNIVEISTGLGM